MRRLPEHRVERGVIIQHQPAFQPISSLVTFVERVYQPTLLHSVRLPSPSSALTHTHQIDVLTVDQDRGLDGTLVDAFGVNNSFTPPFVQHDPNSMFVIVFSSSREDVFVMCLP